MKKKTEKALQYFNAARAELEKFMDSGKIDLRKPSCFYSRKEMASVKRLLLKEKKAREKYYALLSKDMQIEVAQLCGVPAKKGACKCGAAGRGGRTCI